MIESSVRDNNLIMLCSNTYQWNSKCHHGGIFTLQVDANWRFKRLITGSRFVLCISGLSRSLLKVHWIRQET